MDVAASIAARGLAACDAMVWLRTEQIPGNGVAA